MKKDNKEYKEKHHKELKEVKSKIKDLKKEIKKDKQHKKSNKIGIIIGIIIVLFVIVYLFFSGNSSSYNFDKTSKSYSTDDNSDTNQNTKRCKEVQVPYESQEEYMKTEYYYETVPYTDQECENKDIAYSINNFAYDYNRCNQDREVCNDYFLGICVDSTTFCIDKSVSCNLDLRNLDNEKGGNWVIRFNFYKSGTNNVNKYADVSEYLYAQSTENIVGTVRITSDGEEGDANKQYSCNYNVNSIPTKQVCRDVIKYKDVQRSRQVTAYKPVTKYKTETKCD